MTPKNVTFGDITIQEYPVMIGDNPSCKEGAPIQLAWKSTSKTTRNLEMYEYFREKERRHGSKSLVLRAPERTSILLEAGYSIEDIIQATFEVEHAQKLRIQTLQKQGWDRLSMIMIRTGRLPADILKDVAIATSGSLRRAQSVPRDILESTGRTLRRMVQPTQVTKSARTA